MKTQKSKTAKTLALAFLLLAGMSLFNQCKKETETEYVDRVVNVHDTVYLDPNDTGIFVPGTAKLDTSWNFDKTHSNVNWQSKYYDFSATMLTGRFNSFGFIPEFEFDETNLGATLCKFWVKTSTMNTSEPGRDGLGKCGLNYLGVVYTDSLKTATNPLFDTASFVCSSITVDQHDGYVMHGAFTLNHWLNAAGHANGDPITKNIDVNFTYNGMRDFDTNNDGVYDRYRAGVTVTFKFLRSDFTDNASTKTYFPGSPSAGTITLADSVNNITAINNKTYGVWSTSVADEMEITINAVFQKNH
jgi:polyisoprenoid-binding protein YceI